MSLAFILRIFFISKYIISPNLNPNSKLFSGKPVAKIRVYITAV